MDYKEALKQLHVTLAGAKKLPCMYSYNSPPIFPPPKNPKPKCPHCKMLRLLRRLIREIEAEERDPRLRRLTEEIEATNSNPELLRAYHSALEKWDREHGFRA